MGKNVLFTCVLKEILVTNIITTDLKNIDMF